MNKTQSSNTEPINPNPANSFGGFSAPSENGSDDQITISESIIKLPEVPFELNRICKKQIDENSNHVLSFINRGVFFLLCGLFSSAIFILVFIPILVEIYNNPNPYSMQYQANSNIIMSVFVFIGTITLLYLGLRQLFVKTWITFKDDYIEIKRGFFKKGNPQKMFIRSCILNSECTHSENKVSKYKVYIEDSITHIKITLVRGMNFNVADSLVKYVQSVLSTYQKNI